MKPKITAQFAALIQLGCVVHAAAAEDAAFRVNMQVDAKAVIGPVKSAWRFFGADEPNYAHMKNGKKLLGELGKLMPDNVYFRAHSLLCSGDGTPALKWGSTGVYDEDDQGNPIYNWTILDRIFDTYRDQKVRPYVQIGFMPKALSVKPEPYQHAWNPTRPYGDIFTGWAYPPKDYEKWAELVYQWTRHCMERYGADEVARWYWQVWNESNAGYWQGTREEFQKLHDYAIMAVRKALPNARVGGADAAGSGGQFTRDFIEHCLRGKNHATGAGGTPLDFVSFHAKGSPKQVDGHVVMDMVPQLRSVDEGFSIVASYPELKGIPVVIGECDPEGCAACQGPHLAYRNGTMYSSYTAASFARVEQLADRHDVNLEGILTWAFEFEDHPYFAGFRSLASNGIDKPVLNVFRMFSKMEGKRLAVDSDYGVSLDAMMKQGVRGKPDVSAVASIADKEIAVMAWHYHDEDVPGPAAEVSLVIENLPGDPGKATLRHFRVDENHSNAYTTWLGMGSPQNPTPEQYETLERAGQLAELPDQPPMQFENGRGELTFELPRKAVSLLELTWE